MYVCMHTRQKPNTPNFFYPHRLPSRGWIFSSPWMILVFYVYIFFLIFIAKGGRCLRCVLCPDCRRWQKLPLSAQNVHAACLSLMRHHQHHYNFVGVVFSFVFCVFVYAPVLFAVPATLLFNTLHVVFTWRQ